MKISTRTGPALLLIALLALPVSNLLAQGANPNVGRWYQVELILFEQRQEPEYNEVWPESPDLTLLNGAQQLRRAPMGSGVMAPVPAAPSLAADSELPPRWPLVDLGQGKEEPLVILPEPLLQLTDEARRLDESRGRRVLLHTGWNMPVAAEAERDVIRLHAGSRFGDAYETDGTIAIHVGRFLHVETDIYHTRYEQEQAPLPLLFGDSLPPSLIPEGERTPPLPAVVGSSPTFRMGPHFVPVEAARFNERRRMRSNELHYIDHPRLGMIIQFTPYNPVEITSGGDIIEGELDPDADDGLGDPDDLDAIDPL
ncbi:hypothetical protein E4656_05825 [Natronospirillum operosum]|uniref:Peptidoglycan-binding protein CsiV n=1 Tax=Natronospirillum operosum TaxID=2759953 RepID=A0A4Z0WJ76_9GAMM|nr:CsiV family protein [Natronospirillum operosum]TGG95916.1 hypothetical protein E4656_05825 [Natronospirillum operosum]